MTVWRQMNDPKGLNPPSKGQFLQNIYEEGELQRGATHKESLLVRLGNVARESVVKDSLTTEVQWLAHGFEKTIAGNAVEMLEK